MTGRRRCLPALPPDIRAEVVALRRSGLSQTQIRTEIRLGFGVELAIATISTVCGDAGLIGEEHARPRVYREGAAIPFTAEEDALIAAGRGEETGRPASIVRLRARRLLARGSGVTPDLVAAAGARTARTFAPSGIARPDGAGELMLREAALTFWRAADALERERGGGRGAKVRDLAQRCGVTQPHAWAQVARLRRLGVFEAKPRTGPQVGVRVAIAPPAIGGVA